MMDLNAYINQYFKIDSALLKLIEDCEKKAKSIFKYYENIAQINQIKVLNAFKNNQISVRHFNPSTGYGYDDESRIKFSNLFADIFGAEAAIVSPLIMSGTHAISIALFGILKPQDIICFITGEPYDTLKSTLKGKGSLSDYNIEYRCVSLKNNEIDIKNVIDILTPQDFKMCYLQRSTGYDIRKAFTVNEIETAIKIIKEHRKEIIVMVDNCYGEFVEDREPTQCGADIIAGSLIKNPGGGLAPTGGYLAGREDLIEVAANRYSAPGIGFEIGSYAYGYRLFYQGLFLAPHIVCQALKSVVLASLVFETLGFSVTPKYDEIRGDITQTIVFENEYNLTAFIRGIQASSPVDGFVVPYAWDMPGYNDKVIMAAGTFVQSASLEMTADAPMRAPYCAYLQGALTYEHAKISILNSLNELKKENII